MKIKSVLFLLLVTAVVFVNAQMHLGKSEDELIAVLGADFTKVSDPDGNEVLAYYHEIKNHPRFGDYTLLSIYVFSYDTCMMQQSIMPVKLMKKMIKELDEQYEQQGLLVWKSEGSIYYVLSEEQDNLRLKMMKEEDYTHYMNSNGEMKE
jgi:hypothetical protein